MQIQIHHSLNDDLRDEANRLRLRPGSLATQIIRKELDRRRESAKKRSARQGHDREAAR